MLREVGLGTTGQQCGAIHQRPADPNRERQVVGMAALTQNFYAEQIFSGAAPYGSHFLNASSLTEDDSANSRQS